jgi:carbamoyl-phosphate synthase large subunit
MRSTGEVMGISDSFGESFAKASLAAGTALPTKGTIFVSLNDNDKTERAANIVKMFVRLGFSVIATEGTSAFLVSKGITSRPVLKAGVGTLHIIDVIRLGWVQLIVNTPLGQVSRVDEQAIGRAAYEYRVPFITTLSAAASAAKSIAHLRKQTPGVQSIQEYHELASQGGTFHPADSVEDCARLVEYIKSFQM